MRWSALFLLCVPAWPAAEALQGQIRGLGAWNSSGLNSGVINGQACDFGNTSTAVTVKIYIDDPTVSGTAASITGLTCSASNFAYDATQTLGGVNPQDGAQHVYYGKVVSNTNPGAGDFLLAGLLYTATVQAGVDYGYPYKFVGGAVAPTYSTPTVAAGTRLTASKFGLLVNSSDTYSTGTNTGGATLIAMISGTQLWSNGVAGYWANAHGVPLNATNICVVALTVTAVLASTGAGALDTCTAGFASAGLQAVAVGWVQPATVTCPTVRMSMTGYLTNQGCVGGLIGGITGTPWANFCAINSGILAFSNGNPLFKHVSATPFTDTGLFPVMLLAWEKNNGSDTFTGPFVEDFPTAKIGIDAAIAAINSNPTGGNVYSQYSNDVGRNYMARVTPVTATLTNATFNKLGTLASPNACHALPGTNIIVWSGGCTQVNTGTTETWLPGGSFASSLTSTQGNLPYDGTQTPITWYLLRGAAAAMGSDNEQCGMQVQKMPDPILLNEIWQQGPDVLQAIYASVHHGFWTYNLAGDPMAAPWSQSGATSGGVSRAGPVSVAGPVTQQ